MLSGFIETSYRVLLLWLTLTLHPAINVQPGLGDGFWHTRGAQLLDSGNRPVRIAAVNWYGFETEKAAPGGLEQQDYKTILQTIRRAGYNTIRLPFSNQMVETPAIPTGIAYNNHAGPINSDLKGLNSLEVLDKIVAYAGTQGLKIILDNHRSEAGDGTGLSGLWFTQAFPESAWIADWQLLARRYASDPTVIGFDLRNEPHGAAANGACWGCGGPNDWRFAAERAGNAVLAINPRLLIVVEGVDAFENDFYWWGGNLMGVSSAPVRLKVPNQLVYSAHDYGPMEHGQSWLTPTMTDDSLRSVWTKHWAYIAQQNIAPVWLGEFGAAFTTSSPTPTPAESMEPLWFQALIKFLASDTRIGWAYWPLNGEDRYGLLTPNYEGIRDTARQDTLASIQFPLNPSLNQTIIQPVTPTSSVPPPKIIDHGPALPPPPPPPIPYLGLSCTIDYTNTKDWQTGFNATIAIHNNSAIPIKGWHLSWTFDGAQKITQLWSAQYTQNGPTITVTNETWNADIPAHGTLTGIGFNADYTGPNSTPKNFALNGTPCK
jgi:endoglucanase